MTKKSQIQIYLDLDGVLADFDTHYVNHFGYLPLRKRVLGEEKKAELKDTEWDKVRETKDFFLTMPQLPDADILVHGVWKIILENNLPAPIVLTGINKDAVPHGPNQKVEWVKDHYGDVMKVIPCRSKFKSHYCSVGDVLIDDWEEYKDLWIAKGGKFITHYSAYESLLILKAWVKENKRK